MLFKFTKMQALGNDFMVIDTIHQPFNLNAQQIRVLSDRHKGVGFDQLLVVEPPLSSEVDFGYRIFNADGGEVSQCGNGARCIALYIENNHLSSKKHLKVATKAKMHDLILQADGEVSVNMQTPVFEPQAIPFITHKRSTHYHLSTPYGDFDFGSLSVGNPHMVMQVETFQEINIQELGTFFNNKHPQFPEGVNVGFMQILNTKEMNLRVFERGAGLTQACGSGACAAMAIGRLWKKLDAEVLIHMLGGDLRVQWLGENEPIWLTGPATKVFEGEIEL